MAQNEAQQTQRAGVQFSRSPRAKNNKYSVVRKIRTTHKPSIQKMNIEYPLNIDSFDFAQAIPDEDETEVLIDLFTIFAHEHVIEAYKEIQKRYPDLFPPLQEKK